MEQHRRIPYGVMNWAKLVRECHFVDNTPYIRELEKVDTPVFIRPKRFGKSLVCSMLAHYYNVNTKDRFDELFGMTDIGWFRRLARTNANALEKVRRYVERGEGERVIIEALSSKFGRAKFFSAESLCLNGGTWENLFEQYWQHYVKARVPAQALDPADSKRMRMGK